MGTEGPAIVITDTSVLINFLAIGRMDLIAAHPCRFLVTDHVAEEVQEHYEFQREQFQEAIDAGVVEQISANEPAEVELFVQLSTERRLGYGECSAIAVAVNRGYILGIDDRKAKNQAQAVCGDLHVVGTQELVVEMIQASLLSVVDADLIKDKWASDHSFALKIASFADLL